eukprot:350776-Alexandrium_andersonii.AAC.1
MTSTGWPLAPCSSSAVGIWTALSLPPTTCAMIVVASQCPSLSVTQRSRLGVSVARGSIARIVC